MAITAGTPQRGQPRSGDQAGAPAPIAPFARVLIELLAKQWNGTLIVRADGGTKEAAILFQAGYAVAARVESPSAALLQSLIPLCVWVHGQFEFLDREDAVGVGSEVVCGKVDPFALIAAAMRGPVREEVLEECISAIGSNLFRLRPETQLARYSFTAQETVAVTCLETGPLDLNDLRDRAQVPEHALRRVVYVLWVTRALTLLPSVRRAVSGTISHAAPPPPTQVFTHDDLTPLSRLMDESGPLMPSALQSSPPMAGSGARPAPQPPSARIAQPRPAPAAGRYHVQNPSNGLNELERKRGQVSPAVEHLLRNSLRSPPGWSSRPAEPPIAAPTASKTPSSAGRYSHSSPSPSASKTPSSAGHYSQASAAPAVSKTPSSAGRYSSTAAPRPKTRSQAGGSAPSAQAPALPSAQPPAPPSARTPAMPPPPPPTSGRPSSQGLPPVGARPNAMQQARKSVRASGQNSEADTRVALAEALLRRNNYSGALLEMEAAMDLRGSRGQDEALYAWILYHQLGSPEEIPSEVWAHIERAFLLDSGCDSAFYFKGMLLKREGRDGEARAHFRKALRLNPRSLDARRELRVLQMRKRNSEKTDSPSLINRLFKRT